MGNITSYSGTYELQLGHKVFTGTLPASQNVLNVMNNAGTDVEFMINGLFNFESHSHKRVKDGDSIKLILNLLLVDPSSTLLTSDCDYGTGSLSIHDRKNDKCMDSNLFHGSYEIVNDSNIIYTLVGHCNKKLDLHDAKIKVAFDVRVRSGQVI